MSEETTTEKAWWREALAFWPLCLAVTATSGFGWYTVKLAQEVTTMDGIAAPRYQHFLSGRPNEMGDALAGFVGSLTLIWIVASVLQQSMELRAQRREFAEMVKAQGAQVRALEAQAAIFEDEKLRRDEAEAKGELDELLTGVRHKLLVGGYASWDTDGDLETGDLIPRNSFQAYDEATFFTRVPGSIENTLEALQELESRTTSIRYPRWPVAFDEADRDIVRIVESVRPRVSEAMKVRLDRLNLPRISESLAFLRADTSIWGNGDDW